jgi:hypothetical protein
MGSAEQCFTERLKFAMAVLNHRTDVVGEEIGLDVRSRCDERPGSTAIAFEFGLDSNHVSEEIREGAAPAVEREAVDDVAVLWVKPHVGVVHRNLHLGVALRERCAPKKQHESKEKSLLHFSVSPIQIFTPRMPAIRGNRQRRGDEDSRTQKVRARTSSAG